MSDLVKLIQPYIAEALSVLVPLVVGLAAAWLRAMIRKATVRSIVRELDTSDAATGPEKKQMALDRVSVVMPAMTEAKASKLIEAVLPEVRRETPLPPKD